METKERQPGTVDGEELTEAVVLIRTRAPDLESVRKLNCWACNIRDVSIVRRMPNLEVCSLTINKLTSLRDFVHCQNLQELYVRTNNIQKLSDIHYLKHLKKLRSLWLSENPCTTGENYRMTVLKTLPILQKLDNIAVTGDEIARAEQEGDDLPLPDDFSLYSIFKNDSSDLSLEDYRVEKNEGSVSVSSEKWARPREKRQQKKREEYWKERGGADEEYGSARSGDDSGGSCAKGGDDRGGRSMRSSSDSGNEEWYKPKVEEVMSSTKIDDTVQDNENDNVDNPENDDTVTTNDEAKPQQSSDSGIRDKWAINMGIPDSSETSTKARWDIKIEVLDKMADSDEKNDTNKNGVEIKVIDEMIEENKSGRVVGKNTLEKEIDDALVSHSSMEHILCVSSELYNPNVFHERNNNNSEWQDIKNYLPVECADSDLMQSISSISKDLMDFSSTVFDNNSSKNDISLMTDISHVREDNPVASLAASIKVTEQAKTPFLDKAMLEDSLNVLESAEDQTCVGDALESRDSADLTLEIKTSEKSGLSGVSSTQAAGAEATNSEPVRHSVGDSKELVNWEEYNRMRVQLGVRPIDRINTTSRSVNTELTKARNSNILQAVLCLVKELDKDSLDILANTVKGRLDSM